MKKLFTIAALFVLSISTCFSQWEVRLKEMLTDQLGVFSATGDVETKTDSEGILSGNRLYESGDKSLELVIGIIDTEEKIDMMNGYIKDVIGMGERFEFEMQIVENENQFGVITHNQKSESKIGGVFMRTEEFLIRAEITNTEGLQITRDLLKSLGFAVDGSSTSAPKAKASATPKTEAKPATAAQKKMMKMLTDSYGPYNATSDAAIGEGSVVSRSYKSGDKSFRLKIEALKPGAKSTKSNRIKKLRENYKNAELIRIDKEKLMGNLVYDAESNKGLIYLMVRGEHWIVGTINNAAGIKDVQSVYEAFDYSLLK